MNLHIRRTTSFLGLLLLAACNSKSTTPEQAGIPIGSMLQKPGVGGDYFLDSHNEGRSSEVYLVSMFWGRLVDVYDVDAMGEPNTTPVFEDFMVREDVATDGVDYRVETNSLTQVTKLIVLRTKGAPDTGTGTFEDLAKAATANLSPILAKNDDGTAPEPFTLMPRNAAMVLKFDDLLADGPDEVARLSDMIRILEGYPPSFPQGARVIFDPNYGGEVSGTYHATRILIDPSVSAIEAAQAPNPITENPVGLPASLTATGAANISVRVPTRTDFGSNQFYVLENLGGSPISTVGNGPFDPNAPTLDVVRAMRSGNAEDAFHGFLIDDTAPSLVSGWDVTVSNVQNDPQGDPGVDFIVDLTFPTVCRQAPVAGDILEVGTRYVEVNGPASAPDPVTGKVLNVSLRVADSGTTATTGEVGGSAVYRTPYASTASASAACWVDFDPDPGSFPASAVDPLSKMVLRFSEPIDPDTLRAFDSLMVIHDQATVAPDSANTVVGKIASSTNLLQHTFSPFRPLDHPSGSTELYSLRLIDGALGATDLGGNGLTESLPPVEFRLDAASPEYKNGGIVFRFEDLNESDPEATSYTGFNNFRGQATYDLAKEIMLPRALYRESWPIDSSVTIPGVMFPWPLGVDTPLSFYGSKLQMVWRYADVGWFVDDEAYYNMDIEGLSWVPFGGGVNSDYFEQFEIRMAHSKQLPDEAYDPGTGILDYPESGLLNAPSQFADNILIDPSSPPKVVHSKGKGYRIDPNDRFVNNDNPLNTTLMPFPLNQEGGAFSSYLWRDTAILAKAGDDGAGVPMKVESDNYTFPVTKGSFAKAGQVPSVGLPLLVELRCYPSNTGLGLNLFNVALASAVSTIKPIFRVHSTGGVNTLSQSVQVLPDLETSPAGGFNPLSIPPGQTTPSGDPFVYLGQLETVVRVSRVHSVWLDSRQTDPDYYDPILEPTQANQPQGTQVILHFRGAQAFPTPPNHNGKPYNGLQIDAYGNYQNQNITFLNGDPTWKADIDELDGARFVQMRITFINDVETGLSPELTSLAMIFDKD